MKLTIQADVIKALLIIAAKDDVRYYLKGVCVDARENDVTLVATDGHRMLAVPVPETDIEDILPGQYIIPRETLAMVKPCKAGRTTLPLELEITTPAPVPDPERPGVTIQAPTQFTLRGATVATGTVIDSKYPDWRKVMPKSASGAVAQFQPAYVGDFGVVATLLSGRKDAWPTIHHNGTSGALVTGLGNGALGVIMPSRHETEPFPALPDWAR